MAEPFDERQGELRFGTAAPNKAGGLRIRVDALAGEPLRISSVDLGLPRPGSLGAGSFSRCELLLAALERLLDPFDALGRRVLARYFAWLDRRIGRARAAIEARLAPFHGLYAPEDYLFSAPLPLPRAHLPVGEGILVPADVAFWTGRGFAVALARPARLSPAAQRERLARLDAAGWRRAAFDAAPAAPEADDALFDALLALDDARLLDLDRPPVGPGLDLDFPF
ncbi:hypothetical protein [Antarcticirhabdus aurantiaca]|uniref:Uncharacterized protein n=1 Tax=Antarcticirhabdus aurantiaca TaxID=2606717 RepID=A0ACD4NMX6_9HYPH|nr:hypothetical protein [Antarcticirhabdus aurantiaca]WAJ28199.1 hypothetical protein OXU80_25810 [Jeongeuplla avenae]